MAILEADQLQIPIVSLVDFNILDPLKKYEFNQNFLF
jgi:ribosomal protein S2